MPKGPLDGFCNSMASICGNGWNPGLGVGKRPDELQKPSEIEWISGTQAEYITKVQLSYLSRVIRERGLSRKWMGGRYYYRRDEVEKLEFPKKKSREGKLRGE